MASPLKILIIADESDVFRLLTAYLPHHGGDTQSRRVSNPTELSSALQREPWDAVLSEYGAAGMDFSAILKCVRSHDPNLPVILVSAPIGEEKALELARLGMSDLVLKDHLERLPLTIKRCRDEAEACRASLGAEAARIKRMSAALERQHQARLEAQNLLESALAAHAELEKSEAKYRLLAENATECIFWMLPDGEFKYLSPACVRLFGHTDRELLANPGLMTELVHPDDRECYRQHLDNADGDDAELEFRIRHKDGGERWISHHCRSMRDRNGEFLGRRGSNRDITARKRMEQELRDSEERFRIATENVRDAFILIRGEEGRIVLWNPAAAAMFGYSQDEALGRPVHGLLAPARFHDAAAAGMAHFMKTGEGPVVARTLELPATHKSGKELLVELSLSATRLGGRWHAVGVIRDITERKSTEEQLRKLAQVVEQSPESIVITNRDAEIEYVNEVFLRNSGYRREEVIGQNPRILQTGKTPPGTYEQCWETLLRGEIWKGEFVNKRKDGSEYVEFAIISPIRQADGTITHYAAVKEDITEKKRIGRELDKHRHHLEELVANRTSELETARAAADAANQAKSSFLANMSHEIRTPMNAIIGLTYLLRQSGLTDEQRERLDKIDMAAEHLLAIINDILDLSKIDAGRVELEKTDFALEAVLDHIRSLIAEKARAKGLAIELDADSVPHWLRGDPTRLRQAMLNYASNAVKFTESGSICLRAKLLAETEAGLLIRFEVQDTGVGIDEEKLPTLFTAFTQADASITRQYGGTGLGLAITRNLANLMGGDAGVESVLGQGCTFWFTALLQRGRGVTPIDTRSKPVNAEYLLRRNYAGARLLLAEDNPINREVALELLHGVGLSVDTAENGHVALKKVVENHYDLVLMDVQMPEMDGLSATMGIRRRLEFARLPILAMTANAFDDDRQACLAAGMNDFVAKPVNPDELYTTVLRWLSGDGRFPLELASGESAAPPAEKSGPCTALNLPGVNTAAGLAAVKGNMRKYRSLLRMFAQSHRDDMLKVQQWLAEDNILAAHRLAHNLKGVAGTLGARAVSETAATLDNALCREAPLAERLELTRLCNLELLQLIRAILALPDEMVTGAVVPAESDPERQRQLLIGLETLLVEYNARASTLARESDAMLSRLLGADYAEFMRSIEVFDYDSALEILRGRTAPS